MTQRTGGLRQKVPAGLADAGFNSLGTFSVGVAAAQLFDAATLGVYAVFFVSYQLGLVLPMFMIYLPAEVKAVARDIAQRLPILRDSLRYGLRVSLLSLMSVGLAMAVVWSQADTETILTFAVTALVPTALMPAQAHLRRMLHIAEQSWHAASVAAVQFVSALLAIAVLIVLDAPDAAVPFGAFSIAAVISLAFAIFLAMTSEAGDAERIGWRELTLSGRWLLVTGIAPSASAFTVAALIGNLAGPEALGYAEGARLVAQPMMVLGVGLNASLGPRSMEAGHYGDRAAARRVARVFLAIIGVTMLGYLAVAGGNWAWNPLARLVPQAYEVAWLAAATVLVSATAGAVLASQRELFGGAFEKRSAFIDVVASSFGAVLALSAGAIGSFARPLSLGATNAWRAVHYQVALREMYAGKRPPQPPPLSDYENTLP